MRKAGPASTLVLLVALAASACGDATTPEHGGSYVATLNAPGGHTDGAAVIELTGAGVEGVTSVAGRVFVERASAATTRVVVVNHEPGRVQFALQLARGSSMPRATVLEVSDERDQLRATLNGYSVSFAR